MIFSFSLFLSKFFWLLLSLLLSGYSAVSLAQSSTFNYRFAGDNRVAPERVYDDGKSLFLEFSSSQTIPFMQSMDSVGKSQRVDYEVKGSRIEIRSLPIQLVLSYAGGETAKIERVTLPALEQKLITSEPLLEKSNDHSSNHREFLIKHSDNTLRFSLTRWAQEDGWIFLPEHWATNVDIPVSAEASFKGDFKTVVRALFAATELTPVPLQPCFYTNKVLRVIPYTQRCDRGRRES